MQLLLNSCLHSIKNNSEKGYKSDNWEDKKYVNIRYLQKKINLLS